MAQTAKITGDQVKKMMQVTDEELKYLKCWSVDDYRKVSPGERCVDMLISTLEDITPGIKKEHTVIDFGCGTGRAGRAIWEKTGMNTILMDFAGNCLDDDVRELCEDPEKDTINFVEHDITKPQARAAEIGFCTDVMEHLPPKEIDAALSTILTACDLVFFQIDTIHDYFGDHPDIQEDLHLTVWNYNQWLKKFADHGIVIHRSMELPTKVIFFVSGYEGFAYNKVQMNTSADIVFQNIKTNLSYAKEAGIPQIQPCEEQPDQKVVVLGGGPSLNDFVDEIKEHKANGAKIVTTNGTYNWAKEHDLWPVTQFMLDARPFNKRFVEPVDERNIYVMCTQIEPRILKELPPERTWLFQSNLDVTSVDICNELVGNMYEDWFPVCGGSTIMLRALPALFMLGFRDVEVYGFDSCFLGRPLKENETIDDLDELNTQHHAYRQEENDVQAKGIKKQVAALVVADKRFVVSGWMLCQAKEFIEFRRRLLSGMELKVHGDGLIAHCLANNLDAIDDDDGVVMVHNKYRSN
jgi:hypothetical protein